MDSQLTAAQETFRRDLRRWLEARRRRIASCPAWLTGEDIWCQGFSEPGAGTDLAGLGTRDGCR